MSYNHTLTMYRDGKSDVVFHHYKEDGQSVFEISKWKNGDCKMVVSLEQESFIDMRSWMLGERAGFLTVEDTDMVMIRVAKTASGNLQFRKEKDVGEGFRKPFIVLNPDQAARLAAWFKRTKAETELQRVA